MTTSKLRLYNGALRHVGERKLESVTESREPRRALDDVWDLDYFLAQGLWRFARRAVKLEYSPSVEPPFGYSRAFDFPTDWVRTAKVCSDEFFKVPFSDYSTEARFWFTNVDEIYVAYVSNDAAYGGDFSLWLPNFTNWVEAYLASRICTRITGDIKKTDMLIKLEQKLLRTAKNRDVMEEPTQTLPYGSWVNSRSRRSATTDHATDLT